MFGGVGLVLLYLVRSSGRCASPTACEKPFGALVAMGWPRCLVLQAPIGMAVAVNLVPVTGQPLPLSVNAGQASIWFTCLAIGIVLSVSRAVYDNENEASEHRGARENNGHRLGHDRPRGTGGHYLPCHRHRECRGRSCVPDAEFLFVGAEGKMELTKVPEAGCFPIEALPDPWLPTARPGATSDFMAGAEGPGRPPIDPPLPAASMAVGVGRSASV